MEFQLYYQATPLGTAVTYILGSKCHDGVVLIADRKVTMGADYTFADKIHNPFTGVVWGTAGYQAFYNDLNNRVTVRLGHTPTSIEQFLIIVGEAYEKTVDIYGERVRSQLAILIAQRTRAWAELYYSAYYGAPALIPQFQAIGGGSPFGSILVKEFFRIHRDPSMYEVAQLGYLVIKVIEEFELDSTVGVGEGHPQIWFLPHNPPEETDQLLPRDERTIKVATPDELDRIYGSVETTLPLFRGRITDLVRGLT